MKALAACLPLVLLLAGQSPALFRIGGGVEIAAEHGMFRVPANRHRDDSRGLTLRYVRFPSTATSPGAPIVFLAGGPGDAATRAFAGMPRAFLDGLLATADVVAFDQRGTGTSEPRALCPPGAPWPLDEPLVPSRLADGLRERLRRCLASLANGGVDVTGLTTEESADDVEDLRRALGAPRMTLLAGSYGTHLALSVARRHPEAVEKMALFGVEGPDHTLKLPANVDAVLHDIDLEHSGIVDMIRTLTARLRDEPWTKTLPNGQRITVGDWDLRRWVAESLDTTREIAGLRPAMLTMIEGDYSPLVRWTIRFRAPRPLNVMHVAMDCASLASGARLAAIDRQEPSSLLGDAMNFPLPGVCDVPGLPRLGDEFRKPLATSVPALLVSGTWDGRTPPINAREVASHMSRAQLLTIPEASHGLFPEEAAVEALRAFFAR